MQRRPDRSVDFDRDWVDYEDGFGIASLVNFGMVFNHTIASPVKGSRKYRLISHIQ